jgi:hypothetical protein
MDPVTSKAVQAVPSVAQLWERKRLHRRLDGRDAVLEKALQIIEEWDPAVFPHISRISGYEPSIGGTPANLIATIGGSGCVAGDTVVASLGGQSLTASVTTANVVTITAASVLDAITAITAGKSPVLVIRVNNVLCPPLLLPAVTA